jgi:hypothetical protein
MMSRRRNVRSTIFDGYAEPLFAAGGFQESIEAARLSEQWCERGYLHKHVLDGIDEPYPADVDFPAVARPANLRRPLDDYCDSDE